MAGGKSEGSTNPSAVRIRDNQRRSRARHKEYVEGLQKKIQEYERRGVEATLEMQQAARNVAIENSRLRILLGYRGVTNDEVEKFLQTFPDQGPTEVAKATISQPPAPPPPPAASQPSVAIAPKMPLQPLPKPSMSPARAEPVVPQFSHDGSGSGSNSTRSVVDAIVGITREPRKPGPPPSSNARSNHGSGDQRQPLLQPRPQPPPLPILPAIVTGPMRSSPNSVDKLSVLATASAQQDASASKKPLISDDYDTPSPPTIGPSPAMSHATTVTSSGRIHSTSPRDRPLTYGAHDMSCNTAAQIITDMNGGDRETTKEALSCKGRDDCKVRNTTVFRLLEGERSI